MELHEYPRPKHDTGIGIHWVAGYPTATGLTRIREVWIPEMKALGVKWVKVFNHDGALDFIELLLAEGFMPIVRLYRSSPNPGRLGVKETVHLDALIRAGARYFEYNSQPDKESEWKGARLPPNALDLVAENAIADMETILGRGGMPAIPAVSGESNWDLVGRIVAAGRRDLLDGPVWQAIHNYPRNRPLDYPYDIGNQEGAAYTERFYRVVAEEDRGEHAWRGRSLNDVNRLRMTRANAGTTIADDHDCWLAYKHFDALNQRHLGRSIPILSSECGYLVGEDMDPRYPATTPDLHMAQTLEACRVMMGGSRRYDPAPDYYFCTAFWLLANRELGSSSNWWEGHAWYSERWPGGTLPIVRALRTEPKVVRRWQDHPQDNVRITLRGVVKFAVAREQVVLEQDGQEISHALVDARGQYLIDGLLPGRYVVRLQIAQDVQEITLSAKQQNVILNFENAPAEAGGSQSVVSGHVQGGAGAVVLLLRQSDGEEWVTLAREDGAFRFVNLPSGVYSARVHAQGGTVDGIVLDGRNEREIELAATGWGYTVERIENDSLAYTGTIRCVVEGYRHLAVYAQQGPWRSETAYTGSAADHGLFACEISPLDVGDYTVVVDDPNDQSEGRIHLEARVHVDRKQLPLLTFRHGGGDVPESPERSIIKVGVNGAGVNTPITVALIDSQAQRRESTTDDDSGRCEFGGLAEGLYAVEVVGYEQIARRTNIALDGVNTVDVDLSLPVEPAVMSSAQSASKVIGNAPEARGALATLVDDVGNEYSRVVDERNTFEFAHLPAGLYALHVEGGYYQEGIRLNGYNGVEVGFSPLRRSWHAEKSNAGAMPGFSTVRVEVAGRSDLPVHIWQEDGASMVRATGSSTELGPHVAEFQPLDAGIYMVEPDGLDVQAEVELTGLETVWVTFREQVEPVAPNQIRPLAQTGSKPAVLDVEDGISENEPPSVQKSVTSESSELSDFEAGEEESDGSKLAYAAEEDEASGPMVAPVDLETDQAEHDAGDAGDAGDESDVAVDSGSSSEDVAHIDDAGVQAHSADAATEDRFANLRLMGEVVSASLFETSDDLWDSDGDEPESDDSVVVDESTNATRLVDYDYIFVGEGDLCMKDVQRLLTLAAETSPTIGNSLDQASRASRVLLVGDVDEATMATLVQRSVQIERLGGPQ